jgi:hypothetical protein
VNSSSGATQDEWYELRLQGRLDPRWATRLEGMSLRHLSDGTTVVRGPVVDQAALHGLLARFRDIGLPLLSVTRVGAHQPHHDTQPNNPIGE